MVRADGGGANHLGSQAMAQQSGGVVGRGPREEEAASGARPPGGASQAGARGSMGGREEARVWEDLVAGATQEGGMVVVRRPWSR